MSKRPDLGNWPDDEVTYSEPSPGVYIATRRMRIGRNPVELTGNPCSSHAAAYADVHGLTDEGLALLLQAHNDDAHRHRKGSAFDAMRDPRTARKLTGRAR